jgi:hypothetical protein
LVCFYIACQEIHRLQKQVWLTGWSTPYWKFVDEVESEGKHKIDRKLSLHCAIFFFEHVTAIMSRNCAIYFHRYHFNKILVVFRCFGEIYFFYLFLGLSVIFTGPLRVILGIMGVFWGILWYSWVNIWTGKNVTHQVQHLLGPTILCINFLSYWMKSEKLVHSVFFRNHAARTNTDVAFF